MNLFSRLQDFGERIAIVADSGEQLSYRQLAQRADASLAALHDAGGVLAVDGENSVPALCSYVGSLRAGKPVLLLDPALGAESRQQLLQRFGVQAWWNAKQRSWIELRPPATARPHPQLALLLSTSGSTGAAKLVRLSHGNLAANAASIINYLGIGSDERAITSLPMHYSYGMSVVHTHLLAGARLLLTAQPLVARGFWDFFQAQGASSLSGVPAMYDMLERLGLHKMDLPSLRTLTQAGGRLPPERVQRLAQLAQLRGWRFFVMYGQTEAGPRMCYLAPEQALDKPGSIGRAIPGGRMQIVDAEGRPLHEPGREGELVYEGPNVMLGYAQSLHDLELGDVNGGRLATGDLGYQDADGCFHITGRSARFVKMFGRRLSLDEVQAWGEAVAEQAAATGRDDLLLLALVRPRRDTAELRRELIGRFRLQHAKLVVAELAELPRSAAGKLRYSELMHSMVGDHDQQHRQ